MSTPRFIARASHVANVGVHEAFFAAATAGTATPTISAPVIARVVIRMMSLLQWGLKLLRSRKCQALPPFTLILIKDRNSRCPCGRSAVSDLACGWPKLVRRQRFARQQHLGAAIETYPRRVAGDDYACN